MGPLFSKFSNLKWFSETPCRTVMLGLDNAGKTTVLYKLKLGEVVSTIPTIGFNVEEVRFKSLHFTVWDIGGQDKLRPLWRHYYEGTEALIYVVDSCDVDRMSEARDSLLSVVNDPHMHNACILVLANKQDRPDAIPTSKVAEYLGLSSVHNRQWYIQACSAARGEGLYEGLDNLGLMVKEARRK